MPDNAMPTQPSLVEGHTIHRVRDRRRFRRIGLRIEGRIVFAGVDVECLVHEMSSSGVVVECLPLPALGAQVAIDVPEVALSRGIVVRHIEPHLACIDLDMPPDGRADISDRLIIAACRYPPDEAADESES